MKKRYGAFALGPFFSGRNDDPSKWAMDVTYETGMVTSMWSIDNSMKRSHLVVHFVCVKIRVRAWVRLSIGGGFVCSMQRLLAHVLP